MKIPRITTRLVWRAGFLLALAWIHPASAQGAKLSLVADGQPAALVVLAERPTPAARYAAAELVYHVKKATGVELLVVNEGDAQLESARPRVILGATRAAAALGLGVDKLRPEVFLFRTEGPALFIAGNDAGGDPLEPGTFAGTLFGVYEFLERELGARWLWPGELGTFVPKRTGISIGPMDETVAPALFQRNVRTAQNLTGKRDDLKFSPAAAAEYVQAQTVYLRRHRVGKSERLNYRHAFTDWWEKYGREHPEWFQLVNGKRGPAKPGDSYSMCVSDPGLHREIVAQWLLRRDKDPLNGPQYVNVVENGVIGLCECDRCRAWDGSQPADFLDHYPPKSRMAVFGKRFVSDRYARFWLAVQREAEKYDPRATIVAYNYFNYFHAPSPGIKLNDRILVGAYPSSGWYPRSAEADAWFERQWSGWSATGARLFSRGNYCLDGYAMPHVYAHQFAEEFRMQCREGLVATDYDALTGQWAAQGTNIYLLMRLPMRPEAATDGLLAEYYSAFGAAALEVKAYFDYWERYTAANIGRASEIFADNTTRWRAYAKAAHVIFPEACFAPAEALLAAGAVKLTEDAEALARIRYLQAGLQHAKLCSRAAAHLSLLESGSITPAGEAAWAELVAFRRAHEREWIGNFNHSAWTEESSWRLPN